MGITRSCGRRLGLIAAAATLMTVGLTAAPVAADQPPPADPDTRISIFERNRSLAIDAAKVRLNLYVAANPSVGGAPSEPTPCVVASPGVLANSAGSVSAAQAVDLRLQLDPWQSTVAVDPQLRPSTTPTGQIGGLSVITCATQRPSDGSLTRPFVFAMNLAGGVSNFDVARRYGIEPILPVRPADLGGELAGSCQPAIATATCAATWSSRNLVIGITLDGPAGAVNPSVPAPLLSAAVPSLVDDLAVQIQQPASCSAEAIAADTGVGLINPPQCFDGWAWGVTAPCPDTGCITVDVFHVTPDGWRANGLVATACAENFARLGMTGVTATKIVPACNPNDRSLRGGSMRAGSTGQRVTGLQVAMVARGYVLPIDGTYGPLTQAAVMHYQIANGLIVDGVTGQQTRASLGI